MYWRSEQQPNHCCAALALAFFFALVVALPLCAQSQAEKLYHTLGSGVVTISTRYADEHKFGNATGFFIDSSHIITCRHAVEDATGATIETWLHEHIEVYGVTADDLSADLVELAVRRIDSWDSIVPLRLAPEPAIAGASVVIIGAPGGYANTVFDGPVTAIHSLPGMIRLLEVAAPLSPGSSGSPVLNDSGDVVGVVALARSDARVGHAVSVENIADLSHHPIIGFDRWRAVALKHVDFGPSTVDSQAPSPIMSDKHTRNWLGDDMLTRADRRFAERDFSTAFDWALTSCALDPQRAEAWLLAGRCATLLGHIPQALTMLQNALLLKPGDRLTLADLSPVYNMLGRYEDCREVCNTLLARDSNDAVAWCNLGVVEGETHHDSLSLSAFNRAERLAPKDPTVHQYRGRIMAVLSRFPEAEREFRTALSLDSGALDVRLEFALFLVNRNRVQDGVAEFVRILARDPNNPGVWSALAGAYANASRWADALPAARRAIALHAETIDPYAIAANCLHELQRPDEELDAWRSVVAFDDKEAYGHFGLGMALYLYKGDRAGALEQYKVLKTLDAKLAQQLFDEIYK